jgi:hypothetical protein
LISVFKVDSDGVLAAVSAMLTGADVAMGVLAQPAKTNTAVAATTVVAKRRCMFIKSLLKAKGCGRVRKAGLFDIGCVKYDLSASLWSFDDKSVTGSGRLSTPRKGGTGASADPVLTTPGCHAVVTSAF